MSSTQVTISAALCMGLATVGAIESKASNTSRSFEAGRAQHTQLHRNFEPARQIKEGLFVASKVVGGERLYFGLQDRPDRIQEFRNFANNTTHILSPVLASSVEVFSNTGKHEDINTRFNRVMIEGRTPFVERHAVKYDASTLQEFARYINLAPPNREKLKGMLEGIPDGSGHACRKGQDLFSWVSTSPIEDYRDFGFFGQSLGYSVEERFNISSREIDLNEIMHSNRDLVMTVSLSFNNLSKPNPFVFSRDNSYINVAGIFKSAHEIMHGNHRGVSLLFHGFISHAAESLFQKKVYSILDPATSMKVILEKAFVKSEPYKGVYVSRADLYGDIDGTKPVSENRKSRLIGPVYINAKSLGRLFTDSVDLDHAGKTNTAGAQTQADEVFARQLLEEDKRAQAKERKDAQDKAAALNALNDARIAKQIADDKAFARSLQDN